MIRRVAYLTAVAGLGLVLTGCALDFFGASERRAAWRDQEERACMKSRVVMTSAFIQPDRRIADRGACGIAQPLKVSATGGGTVTIGPTATLNCPMTATVEAWMRDSVQPAALAWFGMPVSEISQISDYACRTRNNVRGEDLSEHAFGNAIDIAGFRLADGRRIIVKSDWSGEVNARGFLREIFAAACQRFKTVLGPGVANHADHFHLDLAHHGRDGVSQYCRPPPDGAPPMRAPYGGDLIAQSSRWPRLIDWGRTGSIAAPADAERGSIPELDAAYQGEE